MKIRNIYLLVLALGLLVSSCELSDNIDPKAAPIVPEEVLMTNALRYSLSLIDDMNQNRNVSRFLCQYSSQVQYTDPSRYQFSDRQIPDGYWDNTYLVLRDLMEVRTLLDAHTLGTPEFLSGIPIKKAIVDIMAVLLYQNLVDFFGDVPYTDALGGFDNKTPMYDDARTIYDDLQARLTAVISTLSTASGDSWGAEDLVYGGDVAMWKAFAATLKMRMAMRLADTDMAKAQSELTAGIAAGPLAAGQSMQLPWVGVAPHVNTIYDVFVLANRNDYSPSKTIIDKMLAMNDARLPAFFTEVDTSTEVDVEKYVYNGLPYGLVANSGYSQISHFSDAMFSPSFSSTFACNAEVEFLLAEAAARGMTVTGSAQEHYEAGIAESHAFWGVEMDAAYLAEADVAWDAARAKELIGTQKWLALYNRGNEGYAVWRCFDWPVLAEAEDMIYEDIPARMPFPYNEPSLNFDNYTAAAAAIGGDNVRTLLFWDAVIGTQTPSPGF